MNKFIEIKLSAMAPQGTLWITSNVEGIRWGEKQKPIINRSQSNENDTLLFPKEWRFKKNMSNFVSGKVWT